MPALGRVPIHEQAFGFQRDSVGDDACALGQGLPEFCEESVAVAATDEHRVGFGVSLQDGGGRPMDRLQAVGQAETLGVLADVGAAGVFGLKAGGGGVGRREAPFQRNGARAAANVPQMLAIAGREGRKGQGADGALGHLTVRQEH